MTMTTNKYALTIAEAIERMAVICPLGDAISLVSAPGVGKTTAARTYAERIQLPYEEFRGAEFEPADARGGMYLNEQTRMAEWFSAAHWPTHKCVLCFDEITQAADEMTSPLLKVIRERQIGELKLHPETMIIATGNRPEDRAGGNPRMSSALRESFVQLEVRADMSSWLDWYRVQPEHNMVVEQFLLKNPGMLHQFDGKLQFNQPSPRNWVKVGRMLRVTKCASVMAGLIGPNVVEDFMAFVSTHITLPSVMDVLTGNADEPKGLMSQTAWTEQLMGAYGDEGIDQDALCQLVTNLQTSFAVMFLRHARKTNPTLLRTGAYKKVITKYAKAITDAME